MLPNQQQPLVEGQIPTPDANTTNPQNPHKARVSKAGDIVGAVSRGLQVGGHRNPVSGIVGAVADGLKVGAGEAPNRTHLEKRDPQ